MYVLLEREGRYIAIYEQSSDYADYLLSGYKEVDRGRKKDILNLLEELEGNND